MTMVSNQGRQRGRSKGLLRVKNLHRGQKLGLGKSRITFPGLTTHALNKDREASKMGQISEEEYQEYNQGLDELRSQMGTRRGIRRRQTALERGWTSASPQGRRFGPPEATNADCEYLLSL